jgi:SAM-dependent methyltransferase
MRIFAFLAVTGRPEPDLHLRGSPRSADGPEDGPGMVDQRGERGSTDAGLRRLDEVSGLDAARLAFFRKYLREEYAGPFIDGMGSAEILQMTRAFLCPGDRLDVGSGTAALFWILAVGGGVRTTASDVEPEALVVLRELLAAPAPLPPCYYQAAGLFDVPAAQVELLRRSIGCYLVFNALGAWPAELARASYDSVTAFGCFAICGSEPSYLACVRSARQAVRPGGAIVGADWIRHEHLRERDYSFVSVPTLRKIGAEAGLRVLHLEDVAVSGHETYSGVVLWAFEKP